MVASQCCLTIWIIVISLILLSVSCTWSYAQPKHNQNQKAKELPESSWSIENGDVEEVRETSHHLQENLVERGILEDLEHFETFELTIRTKIFDICANMYLMNKDVSKLDTKKSEFGR